MKKTKKILSLLLTVFMLLSIVPMSDRGIEASAAATNDYTSWKQYDSAWNQVEAWPKSQFPNAQYRLMSEAGCLVTSIAILLRHHNVVTDNNVNNFNPWICNEALKKVGAFTNAADLYYGRVAWAYPDFVYQGSIPYSYANIKSLYEQGFACVIKVYNWHFVALNNVSGNTVNIFDPGSSSRNTIASFSNPLEIFYYKANSNSTPSVQEPTKIVYPTDGGIYKIAAGVGNNMYLDFACTNTNVQIYENCDGHSNPDFVKSQYFKLTHVGDGWYGIINASNGKCMDIKNTDPTSGVNIMQWDYYPNDGQLYRFYDAGNGYCYIKSKLGTYVDVANGDAVNNTNVWAYAFNGSNAQKWKIQTHSHSYSSTVTKAATCTATGIKTFTCYCGVSYTETIAMSKHFDNNANNRCDSCDKLLIDEPNVIIYPADGSIVKLASGVGNNMYLDFNYSNNNVQIYEDCDGHSDPNYVKGQYFKLNYVSDGWYTIVNIGNGNCVDTENENPASGTNLMHWECYFNNGQLFRFYDAGNGYCYIKSKLGCYIDVSNGGNTNNTNVQMYKFNGTDAQKWKLIEKPDPRLDTEKPVISNIKISDVDFYGYTVTCTVTDNVAVARVSFALYTLYNLQDDIVWKNGTINGNTVTFRVDKADHNNESGSYCTDIYAYDVAGNCSTAYGRSAFVDVEKFKETTYKGNNYILYKGIINYEDAEKYCKSKGGHLVKISSQEENDIVADLVASFGYLSWINGTDEVEEGIWHFDDGEMMSYFNWGEGEPNNCDGDQNYLAMNTNSKWDDYHGIANGFICEFDHTHTYTSSVTTQPTCTATGITTYTCSKCSTSYTETIDKKPHTIVIVPAVSATCTKTGLTEGKKCSVCGTVTVVQQTVATVSHIDNNADYKCEYGCGYTFEQPADPTPDEPTTPNTPEENTKKCSCNCHKGGISGLIWKILRFFYKLFKINPVCGCGVAHY